jgi:hypothetical protein
MRSGLLTVGIILLVLGAIFYFIPGPASATNTDTTTTSSDTDVIGQDTVTTGQQTTTTDTTTTDTTTDTTPTSDGTQQQGVNTPVYATADDGTTVTSDGTAADDSITTSRTTQTTTTPTYTTTTTPTYVQDSDTTRTASSSVTTGGVSGNLQRQLAVTAIILGALLTILGLILPDPAGSNVTVNQNARTPGPASRRVVYERDEERRRY